MFGFWDFIFGVLDCLIVVVLFVVCLFVVLCFWYAFVVSTVFLRVLKAESDFRCTEKAEFTDC